MAAQDELVCMNQRISESANKPPQLEPSISSPSIFIQSVEVLNKLEEDTRAFLEYSTPFSPSQVNFVSLSEEKIVIEVQLKKSDEGVAQESEPDPSEPDKKGSDSLSDQPEKSTNDITNDMNGTTEKRSYLPLNGANGLRLTRRAVSECADSNTPIRGILKHHRTLVRRTVSESHVTDEDPDDVFVSSPDLSIDGDEKQKKSVHFNDRIYTTVFRSNSSILSRKNKTLKRTLRRKKKSGSESSSDIESREKSGSSTEDLLKITEPPPEEPPTPTIKKRSDVIARKVMVVKPLLENGTIFTVTPVDDSELDVQPKKIIDIPSTRAGRQDSGYDSEESREAVENACKEDNSKQVVSWQEVKNKKRSRKNRKPHSDQLRKESRVETDSVDQQDLKENN